MRLLLLGKRHSINRWLEDAAAGLRAESHEVRLAIVRDPRVPTAVQRALVGRTADAIATRARRFRPDLILAIGGFHTPPAVLQRLAAVPGRPPIAGWVGDAFDEGARALAELYDAVAYTDTGLLARHRELGFPAHSIFAPHAVDAGTSIPTVARTARMVFVAVPTPGRRAVVAAIRQPIVLHGPAWTAVRDHEVRARRLAPAALPAVYASHLASLNVRNEVNVLDGLNQRNFQPYLAATPLVTDAQADLPLCFEPGLEALVWRDADELNEIYERLLAAPAEAVRVGLAGRARVLAHHTYGRRLDAIADAAGGRS